MNEKIFGSVQELMEAIESNSPPTKLLWYWNETGRVTTVKCPFGELLVYITPKAIVDIVPKAVGYHENYTTLTYKIGQRNGAFLSHYNSKGWIKETKHVWTL